MRSTSKTIQCLAAIILLCAIPAAASAEGNGLLIGESRLHLGIGVEGGQDSNVNYASSNAVSDYLLHVKPMLKLAVPSETVAFELGGTLDVLRYFGVNDTGSMKTENLSTVQGLAAMRTAFNPKGKFIFILKDDFVRSSDPRNDLLGTFAHTTNTAGAGFDFKPGGGTLSLSLAYNFFYDRFDEGTGLSAADSYAHQPTLDIKWAFFPRTAFVLGASGDIRRYPNAQTGNAGGLGFQNSDLNAIRSYVGILGMITPKLSMNLRAGFGDTLAVKAGAQNYASVTGMAEFQYDLAAATRFTLGYTRDFQPAPIYGYYSTDRIRASATQGLFGKLTLSLDASVDLEGFGRQIDSTGKDLGTRSDVLTVVIATIDYAILQSLTIGVSDNLQLRSSSMSAGTSSNYTKNVALLKLTFFY